MANRLEDLNGELSAAFPENRLVFGEGRPGVSLMLIGEAPGENEEAQGRPFVGKAGKNLDEFLRLSGIDRTEVYITNAVKVRPFKIGKSGRKSNRPPTREEIDMFRPFLVREIGMVRPKYAVTLGNVPLYAVTGEKLSIGACHGQELPLGTLKLYPMYHPASVIYNQKLREVYIEDVMKLGELLRAHD